MEHLYMSTVAVERIQLTSEDGQAVMDYDVVEGLERVPCRLDLNFIRPGKDIPAAPVAGKAPDRMGLMFCDTYWDIRGGDRVKTVINADGKMPVSGTFEIKVIPDMAIDYDSAHHQEIQVVETNQNLSKWPSDEDVDQ